jgi:hypothetical protein
VARSGRSLPIASAPARKRGSGRIVIVASLASSLTMPSTRRNSSPDEMAQRRACLPERTKTERAGVSPAPGSYKRMIRRMMMRMITSVPIPIYMRTSLRDA